jgi:hypothetical protein
MADAVERVLLNRADVAALMNRADIPDTLTDEVRVLTA